jgi:hypothetical protein
MRKLPGLLAFFLILSGAALADTVPPDLQRITMEHFLPSFVYPDLVQWEWDSAKPYPLGGTAVCGKVNFPNSNRRYLGYKEFYALVVDGKYQEGGIVGNNVQDPAGAIGFAYRTVCGVH